MACRTIRLSDGRMAIACGPRIRRPLRRCVVCNISESMASIRLCDAPVGAGTCDAVVCVEHARHREPDTDCARSMPGCSIPRRTSPAMPVPIAASSAMANRATRAAGRSRVAQGVQGET